jgi:hypothetical protein
MGDALRQRIREGGSAIAVGTRMGEATRKATRWWKARSHGRSWCTCIPIGRTRPVFRPTLPIADVVSFAAAVAGYLRRRRYPGDDGGDAANANFRAGRSPRTRPAR